MAANSSSLLYIGCRDTALPCLAVLCHAVPSYARLHYIHPCSPQGALHCTGAGLLLLPLVPLVTLAAGCVALLISTTTTPTTVGLREPARPEPPHSNGSKLPSAKCGHQSNMWGAQPCTCSRP